MEINATWNRVDLNFIFLQPRRSTANGNFRSLFTISGSRKSWFSCYFSLSPPRLLRIDRRKVYRRSTNLDFLREIGKIDHHLVAWSLKITFTSSLNFQLGSKVRSPLLSNSRYSPRRLCDEEKDQRRPPGVGRNSRLVVHRRRIHRADISSIYIRVHPQNLENQICTEFNIQYSRRIKFWKIVVGLL